MNYKKITNALELTSKACAVMTAPAIVLSTAATVVLFPLTIALNLAAGNLREKFNLIIRNPVALVFLLFCALFLFGALYSTAPWQPDILLTLRKYDKFLFAVLFFPLFTEERWRNYAINAFMIAILALLIASYFKVNLYYWSAGSAQVFNPGIMFDFLISFGASGGSHDGSTWIIEIFKPSIEFNFLMSFAAYLCLFKITSIGRYRLMWIIFLISIVYTVLFRSIGRSGYFVFGGLMILFFVQKFRWRGLFLAIIGVALLFGLAFNFSSTFKQRVNAIFSDVKEYHKNDMTSVGLRMTFVKNSIGLIKKHPMFGAGTGSFAKEYAAIEPTPSVLANNPHNEYAYITVQFGILGLVIILLFFGVPIWYSQYLPEEQKYLARGVILGIMLGSLANSWLLDVTSGHLYAYFIALAFAALPDRDGGSRRLKPALPKNAS
ncbi:MAG TPA: hypothetical protein DCZ38_03560 [Coxiellaceae bacterium]|nr:MAG: hypothetical protein A2V89_00660 [Gammaproteobacteria bacterium RBG_16_37_9]HBC71838.1 hypothetical protein [Coxiellaceae bacterium]